MARNLERLVQKAKAERPQRQASNALPIFSADRGQKMWERIDRLIAQGTLAEADRPRCVYWGDFSLLTDLTPEQLAVVTAQYENEKDKLPDLETVLPVFAAFAMMDRGVAAETDDPWRL
jgi:hypothetical protein